MGGLATLGKQSMKIELAQNKLDKRDLVDMHKSKVINHFHFTNTKFQLSIIKSTERSSKSQIIHFPDKVNSVLFQLGSYGNRTSWFKTLACVLGRPISLNKQVIKYTYRRLSVQYHSSTTTLLRGYQAAVCLDY